MLTIFAAIRAGWRSCNASAAQASREDRRALGQILFTLARPKPAKSWNGRCSHAVGVGAFEMITVPSATAVIGYEL